jgi:hypothetical protein
MKITIAFLGLLSLAAAQFGKGKGKGGSGGKKGSGGFGKGGKGSGGIQNLMSWYFRVSLDLFSK